MLVVMTPLDRALRLLARKAYTAQEMEKALEKAGLKERERAEVVARLRELGYMDDLEVARARARTLLGRGAAARLAERRLGEQGVDVAQARTAVGEAAEGATEAELLGRDKERRRAFRALVAKGHRPSQVARALGIGWDGDDD